MSTTDDYAGRIAEGLRRDGYPNRMSWVDVAMAASRYGVAMRHGASTIRETSLLIAQAMGGAR